MRAAIRDGQFDPAYYLYGDEDFLKDQALRELLDAALDPSTRDFNFELLRGAEVDAETLGSVLGTPPMMAARRAVLVRDVHALKKAARSQLDRYLDAPAPDTLLVLVDPVGQTPDADLLRRTTACAAEPLAHRHVQAWITQYVEKELGLSITDDAAALLEQSVGGTLQALAGELDKCASYARGALIDDAGAAVIDDEAVSAVVGIRRGETVADLLDAVAMRDTPRAVMLLPYVMSQPKVTGVSLVMALATQTLAIAWGRARRDAGISASRLPSEYTRLLKSTGAFPGRPWGEAGGAWAKAVDQWNASELRAAIRSLQDTDVALKDTKVSHEEQVVLSLILALAPSDTGAGRKRGRAA